MTPLLYAKIGGVMMLIALLFGAGYHLGGLSADDKLNAYKTAVEAQHAAQLQAVVTTMDEHDHQAALERMANQKVIDTYDLQKNLPPITAGLVERMRLVEAAAACADDSGLPKTGAVAGGAQAASGIPRSDPEAERLLQAALDAADRDSGRLNAAVKLAP
jgi:hypothetical protein